MKKKTKIKTKKPNQNKTKAKTKNKQTTKNRGGSHLNAEESLQRGSSVSVFSITVILCRWSVCVIISLLSSAEPYDKMVRVKG